MFFSQRPVLFFLFLTSCINGWAQHYNFISYNAEAGLPQSQVFGLLQSGDRQLWMSTLGGISRFDGKNFHNYSVADGLSASYPLHFMLDQQQRIWALNTTRLDLIENNKIKSWRLPEPAKQGSRLAVSYDRRVWCVIGGKLYQFNNGEFSLGTLEGLANKNLFALLKGPKDEVYLMAERRTLYHYHGGNWKLFAKLDEVDTTDRIRNVHFDDTGNTWIITSREIFVKRRNEARAQSWLKMPDSDNVFNCVTSDKSGDIWIGALRGAYQVRKDRSVIHYNGENGFSDARVNDLLTDVEGNLWLASDGEGLYRFAGASFTSYINEEKNAIQRVQAVSVLDNQLVFGNNGSDLSIIHNEDSRRYILRGTKLADKEINCLYTDRNGTIWIGTFGDGLWSYREGIARSTSLGKVSVYSIYENAGRMLITTDNGLYHFENGSARKNRAVAEFSSSAVEVGLDSVLVALTYGLALIRDSTKIDYAFPSNLQNTMVTCFEKKNEKIFIGTIGGGLFVWNMAKRTVMQFSGSSGLPSNIIYSLMFDKDGHLWAGTGKGISRISSSNNFESVTIYSYGKEHGLDALECNKDAIAVTSDNSVWFGTVKGLYRYRPGQEIQSGVAPVVTLEAIKVFSKPLEDSRAATAYSALPPALRLSSQNNHITFEFRAISYSYSNIRYSYYLQGLETKYSEPNFNDFVVYPSLPPGDYGFFVKAVDESGNQVGETAHYSFSIVPAFYQTGWFKILLVLAIIALAALVYMLNKKYRDRQRTMIENLRAEEQRKIRKKTAQDFHDEMGNKLARITVLSDILKTKIPANEETTSLAKKIQDNVAWLYQGTKDIIWSLNPENDNLQYLLKHISDFGVDLFIDTDIEFEPLEIKQEYASYSLPMDYARNIIMICKEVFTNTLKHSQASKVRLTAELVQQHHLRLSITDNGRGISNSPSVNGNGLSNIKQRAAYLGASLDIHSTQADGTRVTLLLAIPGPETEKTK